MPKTPTIETKFEYDPIAELTFGTFRQRLNRHVAYPTQKESHASHKVTEPRMVERLDSQATLSRRERESSGNSLDGRIAALAATLHLPGLELVKLVQYWIARLPATDPNRMESRQDLEQEITLALLAQSDRVTGQWDIGKMVVMDAYSTYYRAYRAQGAIGEPQAISLEGKAFRELLAALAEDGGIPTFDELSDVDHSAQLEQVLPEPIRNAIRKRLMGQVLNATERTRLKRFRDATTAKGVPGNMLQAQAVLEGSTTEPKWITHKRGGARPGAGRKPNHPRNGPIVTVKNASK